MDGAEPDRIVFAHLLRGIAAGCVVLHHFFYFIWEKPKIIAVLTLQPSLPHLIHHSDSLKLPDFGISDLWGHFGVALFFLISGFVIPLSLSSSSASGFALKRVLRIWPTYIAGFSISILCLTLNARQAGVPFPYSYQEIIAHYLILPRWPTLTRPIDGIIWTLEIEVFFYAFCLIAVNRMRAYDISLFSVVLLSVPAAYLSSALMPSLVASNSKLYPLVHWAGSMLQFLPFLLVGTAYYFFYQKRISLITVGALHSTLLTAFILSWHLGLLNTGNWNGPFSYLLAYSVFAAAFTFRGQIARLPAFILMPGWKLADISYPLYVVHGILGYSVAYRMLSAGYHSVFTFSATAILVMAAAFCLHFAVERPSNRLGKLLARRTLLARRAARQ